MAGARAAKIIGSEPRTKRRAAHGSQLLTVRTNIPAHVPSRLHALAKGPIIGAAVHSQQSKLRAYRHRSGGWKHGCRGGSVLSRRRSSRWRVHRGQRGLAPARDLSGMLLQALQRRLPPVGTLEQTFM